MKLILRLKGGEGSGNFGHAGRPGMVGGSDDGNGGSDIKSQIKQGAKFAVTYQGADTTAYIQSTENGVVKWAVKTNVLTKRQRNHRDAGRMYGRSILAPNSAGFDVFEQSMQMAAHTLHSMRAKLKD